MLHLTYTWATTWLLPISLTASIITAATTLTAPIMFLLAAVLAFMLAAILAVVTAEKIILMIT